MTQIGFVLSHEQFPAPQLVELGVAAEEAGFDMVWTSDHFHPWMHNQGHAGQAWVTLAALGQRTKRIRFGTGVTCPTYRYQPTIVAQAFASLGVLYPERVFLGVGTGEALNELPASGEWGNYEERAARWVEAVELIRQLWTGEWITYEGQYYQVENARLYDVPEKTVPLYMAAEGPKSMHKAGQYGDGLISDSQRARKPEMRQAFEAGAHAAGKDPQQMPILAEHFVVVGGEAEAREAAAQWRFIPKAWDKFVNNPDPRSILQEAKADVGDKQVINQWLVSNDPEEHVQSIRQLFAAGITEVYIHSGQTDQQRVIDFYKRDVLPRLRQ
ncbi:MAG: TIGR03557 family F420-dependent LLM class oxidoreductase [Caldilineaceae bacterium]|nr:TIGR03557 family F420-dependent LLM class oxidoreductase [Caldilineaceae bacterium]